MQVVQAVQAVLQAYSQPVQKFIFAHECAHSDPAVAEDEAAADCAAETPLLILR